MDRSFLKHRKVDGKAFIFAERRNYWCLLFRLSGCACDFVAEWLGKCPFLRDRHLYVRLWKHTKEAFCSSFDFNFDEEWLCLWVRFRLWQKWNDYVVEFYANENRFDEEKRCLPVLWQLATIGVMLIYTVLENWFGLDSALNETTESKRDDMYSLFELQKLNKQAS